jgi:Clip-domain serine protease homolog masquerade
MRRRQRRLPRQRCEQQRRQSRGRLQRRQQWRRQKRRPRRRTTIRQRIRLRILRRRSRIVSIETSKMKEPGFKEFFLPIATCPGVCVADRIAEYCEAYLKIPHLCQTGTKCCVSRDIYGDKKPPPELQIPTVTESNETRTTPRTAVEPMTMQSVSSPGFVLPVLPRRHILLHFRPPQLPVPRFTPPKW